MEENGFDSINVIPLVDVMLVLLTIVLTTSTFIAVGVIPVELPKAENGTSKSMQTTVIEIDRQGDIYLDARPASVMEIREKLRPMQRSQPILIRADREITLQVFVDVMDMVKGLGFRKISLQTQSSG